MNDKAASTFEIPTLEEMEVAILKAKKSAIKFASECKMNLISYDDKELVAETSLLVEDAIQNDFEEGEYV